MEQVSGTDWIGTGGADGRKTSWNVMHNSEDNADLNTVADYR